MLSKCDENESSKMAANIPTTMNEWSQAQEDQIIDEKRLLMASSTRRVMEKPITLEQQQQQQQQQQQPQQPLNCPRCDSSNTKFCYYNNYSLSQPRHFCKACKRYWTRGGTLRNVPVGGGCRKNKRVKRPSSSSTAVTAATGAAATTAVEPPVSMASIDNSTTSSSNPHHVNPNPLFYDMNSIPYPRLNNSSIIDHLSNAPHFGSGLGLGFSSGSIMTTDHGGGGGDNSRYIQDLVSSASFLPSNYSSDGIRCISTGLISPTILSSSTSTTTTAPIPSMASLLSSSIQQQKQLMNGDLLKDVRAMEEFKAFSPFQDPRGVIGSTEQGLGMKDVKLEGQNIPGGGWSFAFQNQMDHQVGLSSDLSSPHYWNISNVGGWHDPTNNGSSVPSMI